MSSRTQDVIDRTQKKLYGIEWAINSNTSARKNAEYLLSRSWWQMLRGPVTALTLSLALVGVGVGGTLNHADDFAASFYLIGGIGGFISLLWLGSNIDERRGAPAALAYALHRLKQLNAEKSEAEADLERAQKRQEILANDTRWVGDQVKNLAATAGWSDKDIDRLDNVFTAVAEDFRA